jgi:hypothetical protein
VARPNPFVIFWRWRYELGLTLFLGIALLSLASTVGWWWELALIGAVGGVVATWPTARRHVIVQSWRIVTPHRVRTACKQAWIHSRWGKIPIILMTTAEPFGERVYMWLRAGVSVEYLIEARALLATACWADDVHVARHERFAHIAILDVIRTPLTGPSEDDFSDLTEPPTWPQAGGMHQS